MNLSFAADGAIAGMPIGVALRGVAYRLAVPSNDPYRRACTRCATRVPWLPGFRCARCGDQLGTPWVIELATATVLGLVFGMFGGRPLVLAFGFFGVLAVALSAVDIAVQRLPDRLTLPAYPVLFALLVVVAVTGHEWGTLGRAALGAVGLGGGFLVLGLLRPGQLGGGDVKLAGLIGLVLGWLGWPTLIAGALLAFLLSAAVSLVLLFARRVTMRSAICFGPFMLTAALLAILTLPG